MNYIRSNIEENNVRIGNSKENYGKLIVTLNETDYVVGEFHDTTGKLKINGIDIRSKDIWYSFDPKHNNFHIVPDYKVIKDFDLLTSYKGAKDFNLLTSDKYINYFIKQYTNVFCIE